MICSEHWLKIVNFKLSSIDLSLSTFTSLTIGRLKIPILVLISADRAISSSL